jgi:hypothetical protein
MTMIFHKIGQQIPQLRMGLQKPTRGARINDDQI